MAQKRSSEQERTLLAVRAGRHPDTVKRFANGLPVTATTAQAIESACHELDCQHVVFERLRALAAKDGE